MTNNNNAAGFYFSSTPYKTTQISYTPSFFCSPPRVIQEEFIEIPLDEYVIVQELKLNSRERKKNGEIIKKTYEKPTVIINHKSPDNFIPLRTIYPDVRLFDSQGRAVYLKSHYWMK